MIYVYVFLNSNNKFLYIEKKHDTPVRKNTLFDGKNCKSY